MSELLIELDNWKTRPFNFRKWIRKWK